MIPDQRLCSHAGIAVKGMTEFMQRDPHVILRSHHVFEHEWHATLGKRDTVSVRHLVRTRREVGKSVAELGELLAQFGINSGKNPLNSFFQISHRIEGPEWRSVVRIDRRAPIEVPRLKNFDPQSFPLKFQKLGGKRNDFFLNTSMQFVTLLRRVVVSVIVKPDQLPVSLKSGIARHGRTDSKKFQKKFIQLRTQSKLRPLPSSPCPFTNFSIYVTQLLLNCRHRKLFAVIIHQLTSSQPRISRNQMCLLCL